MKIEEPVCLHGQRFDNRKRWCANCDKTVVAQHFTCNECGALWPEHVENYLQDLKDNGLEPTEFGADATWH